MRVRTLWIGACACILVLAGAPAALAHAAYKDSQPGDEEVVHEAPDEVRVEFTEPPTDTSYLEVFNECGDQVDSGDTQVIGYELVIGLEDDSKGLYTVTFVVQSALDSHVTEGDFTFTAHAGPSCGPATTDEDPGDDEEPDPDESPAPAEHDDHDGEDDDAQPEDPQPPSGGAAPTATPSGNAGPSVGGVPAGPSGGDDDGTRDGKRDAGGKSKDKAVTDKDQDDATLVADAGSNAGESGGPTDLASATAPGGGDLEPYLGLVLLALMALAAPGVWLIRSLADSPDDRAGAPLGSMWAKPPA